MDWLLELHLGLVMQTALPPPLNSRQRCHSNSVVRVCVGYQTLTVVCCTSVGYMCLHITDTSSAHATCGTPCSDEDASTHLAAILTLSITHAHTLLQVGTTLQSVLVSGGVLPDDLMSECG